MGNFNDLTGREFGRLKVLYRDDTIHKSKGAYWICQCSCINKTIRSIRSSDLTRTTRGGTKSCGCLSKEMLSKLSKKYNKYDLSGEYGIGYTEKGSEFYFDLDDYSVIKDYYWNFNDGYLQAHDLMDNRKIIRMHRLVTNAKENEEIDHIFHNKNDNRKSKLRTIIGCGNKMNAILRKDNTSGIKGVNWHSRDKLWEVSIQANNERIYIGRFNKFEEAVRARKLAEDKYHGEYSYDNSMALNQ